MISLNEINCRAHKCKNEPIFCPAAGSI
jgi:hypothetical protein